MSGLSWYHGMLDPLVGLSFIIGYYFFKSQEMADRKYQDKRFSGIHM